MSSDKNYTITSIQQKRFVSERRGFITDRLHFATAYQSSENPFIWYGLIVGQDDVPKYKGGLYIVKFILDKEYPIIPGMCQMLTPSGTRKYIKVYYCKK